jgi:hypothetical protein
MSFLLGTAFGLVLGWFFLPQPQAVRDLIAKTPLGKFMRS